MRNNLTFWRHFPLAMQYDLVPCALQRHVRQTMQYYTIIDLCWDRHGVLLNSKRHIDQRGAEVNMIKFTV